jgi:hypothetical protein
VESYFVTDPYYTSAFGIPPMPKPKSMDNFLDYLRSINAAKATIVAGPNGKFISVLYKEGADVGAPKTFPIGKKSQNGELRQFNALACDDGTVIATINSYEELDSVDL